jgi:hypothetical protein
MAVGAARAEGTARAKRGRAKAEGFVSAADLQAVLTQVLSEIDRDSDLGPELRSAKASYRYLFTDLGLVLNVTHSEEDEEHCIRWTFSDDIDWIPELVLEMSSDVANRFLQGEENLAIAVTRGRIRCSSDVRAALRLLPTLRRFGDCYRSVIERDYPHLLLH